MTTSTDIQTTSSQGRARVPVAGLLALSLLLLLGAPGLLDAGAGTIPTGPAPVDTVIHPSGATTYVLNSGNATVSIIDNSSKAVTGVINLTQPPGVCLDMDWNGPSSQLIIGCSNGQVLFADPATMLWGVIVNNPGANYGIVAAENFSPPTVAWAIDLNSGWLDMIQPGVVVPSGPAGVGAPVELVEKAVDGTSPPALNGYLPVLGTSALGFTNVSVYNRATMLWLPLSTYGLVMRTATGIDTSVGTKAYISTQLPAGAGGDLLELDLLTMLFNPAPVHVFAGGNPLDVAVAGQWIQVLEAIAPGPGTNLHTFDAGNPGAVLYTGYVPTDPMGLPFGGLDAFLHLAGSIDDLVISFANTTPDVYVEDSEIMNESKVTPAPGTVATWTVNQFCLLYTSDAADEDYTV